MVASISEFTACCLSGDVGQLATAPEITDERECSSGPVHISSMMAADLHSHRCKLQSLLEVWESEQLRIIACAINQASRSPSSGPCVARYRAPADVGEESAQPEREPTNGPFIPETPSSNSFSHTGLTLDMSLVEMGLVPLVAEEVEAEESKNVVVLAAGAFDRGKQAASSSVDLAIAFDENQLERNRSALSSQSDISPLTRSVTSLIGARDVDMPWLQDVSLTSVALGAIHEAAMSPTRSMLFIGKSDFVTVAELIGKFSFPARIVFLFGGHARFASRSVQIAYNTLFVGSFTLCFLFCLTNMFLKTPPSTTAGTDVLTVYIHVVGLHAWLFWHGMVRDPCIKEFVIRQCVKSARGPWIKKKLKQVSLEIKVGAYVLLLGQLLFIALGFVSFPHPAFEHWMDVEGSETPRMFAFAHAVAMWAAIPQHMPSIVAGHGLFFFLLRIHSMDVEKIAAEFDLAAQEPGGLDVDGDQIVEELCSSAEKAQGRLDVNCRKWAFLWLHQVAFAFMQVCHTVVSLRYRMEFEDLHLEAGRVQLSDGLWQNLFHGTVGLAVLCTSVVSPAMLTRVCWLQCRSLLIVMRHHRASIMSSELGAGFLQVHVRGFTAYDCVVDGAFAAKFFTVVGFCGSLYIWLSSGQTWTPT